MGQTMTRDATEAFDPRLGAAFENIAKVIRVAMQAEMAFTGDGRVAWRISHAYEATHQVIAAIASAQGQPVMTPEHAGGDLSALRERVEGAAGPDRQLDYAIGRATGHPSFAQARDDFPVPFMARSQADKDVPLWTASIDAALALVERKGINPMMILRQVLERIGSGPSSLLPLAILSALLTALEQQP